MNSSETSTSAGNRNAAIWATEFLTTEIARSALALGGEHDAGDVLDRVAGDRDDHEAGERLGDAERSIAGSSAAMNQSETNAAPTPATASSDERDARSGSARRVRPPRSARLGRSMSARR